MHEYHYIRYHFVRRSDCTYIIYHGPKPALLPLLYSFKGQPRAGTPGLPIHFSIVAKINDDEEQKIKNDKNFLKSTERLRKHCNKYDNILVWEIPIAWEIGISALLRDYDKPTDGRTDGLKGKLNFQQEMRTTTRKWILATLKKLNEG